MDNSDCIEVEKSGDGKVCKCKDGYMYSKNSENCLKEGIYLFKIRNSIKPKLYIIFWIAIATQYNEECSESEQCKPLLGPLGKCLDENCTCEDHLQYRNGKCLEKKGC